MKKIRIIDELRNLEVQTRRKEKKKKATVNIKWVICIMLLAFAITFLLSFLSEITIPKVSLIVGITITFIFIFLGILFDIVGVAVTSANEKVFHSMSSRKVRGAQTAVFFKKNAEKVSSFCCDVVGDICGVMSGSASIAIAALLVDKFDFNILFVTLVVTGIVASFTIGGKAIGKSIAINKSNIILYEFAKIVSFFY